MEYTKKLLNYFLGKIEDDANDFREVVAEMRLAIRVLSRTPSYIAKDIVSAIMGEEETEDAE